MSNDPQRVKVYLFDDNKATREAKTINIGMLGGSLVIESSPVVRQANGEKTDWANPPGDKSIALKVITYDESSTNRTVKQDNIDGLETLMVHEGVSSLREG